MIRLGYYRLSKNRFKWTSIVIIIIFAILSYKGVVTDLYKNYLFDNLKAQDIAYIDKTSKDATDLFLRVSLAKGIVAVIEGSSIHIDAIIGGELEVGDIVQPVYDAIDIIWKVSLVSTISLKIQSILIKNTELSFFKYLITGILILLLPSLIYSNRLTILIGRVAKSLFILTLLTYFLFPVSIYLNSLTTEYINRTYRAEAVKNLDIEIKKLEIIKEELFKLNKVEKQESEKKSFFNFGIKDKIEDAKNKFLEINSSLKKISENIILNLPIILTVYIFNTMLLPLIIVFILYKTMLFIILNEII